MIRLPSAGRGRRSAERQAEYVDQAGVDEFYDALEAARAECQLIMPDVARRLAGVEEQP